MELRGNIILIFTVCFCVFFSCPVYAKKHYGYRYVSIEKDDLEILITLRPHMVGEKNPYCAGITLKSKTLLADKAYFRISSITTETGHVIKIRNKATERKLKAYETEEGYFARSIKCDITIPEYKPIVFKGSVDYGGKHIPIEIEMETDYKNWFDPFAWFDKFAV